MATIQQDRLMAQSSGFREKFLVALDGSGLSVAEVARRSGVSYDVINKLKRRDGSSTSAENAAALMAVFGEVAPSLEPENLPDDGTLIPVYDVAASAGNGTHIDGEEVTCNMAFDRGFLRRMTDARASELAIIRVKGHSMEPTLLDDDHVLVDRTKTNLSFDGLFVIRFDDALHIKRIGRSASRGNVLVISDHPSYPDLDMPKENLDVIGRVLWVGRKV